MFGSKRIAIGGGDQVGTIIGQGTQLKGNVAANASLRIDGEIEGETVTAGEIIIGDTGVVKAAVKARSALVGGTVTGRMEVAEKLELLPTAKVIGDIQVGLLVISEGAVFKGLCEMRMPNGNQTE